MIPPGDDTGNRGAPAERARPERDPDPPVAARTDGGADSAEPAGEQDPAAEAERTRETDRLRDVRTVNGEAGTAGDEAATPGDEAEASGAVSESDGPGAAEPGREASADDALSRLEAERDEYLTLAQRTQADFDNYRKRAARDAAAAGARAKAELVRAMLPVLDNLERALESAGDDEASLAEGVRLVHAELVGALERSGVSSIEAAGQRFDPNVHEALSTRADNGTEAGTVLDVVQKGYRLDDTVLRPARVVVAA